MTILESKIETYLKTQIKLIGGLCYKFKSTINGVPDQLVIYDSKMYLIEVKRPTETPRANQVYIHEQIEKQGVPVYVVDCEEQIDDFIRNVLNTEPVLKSDIQNIGVVMTIDAFK